MDSGSNKKNNGLAASLDGKTRALRVSEVAGLFNISDRQVYKLAAEHRIPCFKIGGSIRFDPSAIAAWLRQKMPSPSIDYAVEQKRAVFNREIREQRRMH